MTKIEIALAVARRIVSDDGHAVEGVETEALRKSLIQMFLGIVELEPAEESEQPDSRFFERVHEACLEYDPGQFDCLERREREADAGSEAEPPHLKAVELLKQFAIKYSIQYEEPFEMLYRC